MFQSHKVVAVVAIGKNRELGNADKLLWHIPDDLRRFKSLTRGHPIIMGRKTFESIVQIIGKPLPERTNIVVTRDSNFKGPTSAGVMVANSLEEALEIAKDQPGSGEIHIGGGAQIYQLALPYLDTLCLTLIDDEARADTFFPEYEQQFPKKTVKGEGEWEGLKYAWVDFERA